MEGGSLYILQYGFVDFSFEFVREASYESTGLALERSILRRVRGTENREAARCR